MQDWVCYGTVHTSFKRCRDKTFLILLCSRAQILLLKTDCTFKQSSFEMIWSLTKLNNPISLLLFVLFYLDMLHNLWILHRQCRILAKLNYVESISHCRHNFMEALCHQLSRWTTMYLSMCHATPSVYLDIWEWSVEHDWGKLCQQINDCSWKESYSSGDF